MLRRSYISWVASNKWGPFPSLSCWKFHMSHGHCKITELLRRSNVKRSFDEKFKVISNKRLHFKCALIKCILEIFKWMFLLSTVLSHFPVYATKRYFCVIWTVLCKYLTALRLFCFCLISFASFQKWNGTFWKINSETFKTIPVFLFHNKTQKLFLIS